MRCNCVKNCGPWPLVALLVCLPGQLRGQNNDIDHEHDLHFTHPIFTESVSPDRKVRLDFGREWEDEGTGSELEVEVEYPFHRSFSVEVGVPYGFSSPDEGSSESNLGSAEVALKFANFAFENSGVLLGYGLEVGIPTGDSSKGIGDGHIWELEPFLNIGVKTGNVELVAWSRFGIPTNQRDDEEIETEIAYDFSMLYHFSPRVQGLVELNGHGGLSGEEVGEGIISLSPGIKLAPFAERSLFVGVGGSFPLGEQELKAQVKLALFYHF